MINTIKIDGQTRDRKSKAMFTGDHSQIEIQCYECGEYKEIKKLTNDHITKKFECGKCSGSRKIKAAFAKKRAVKKKTKKKVAAKPKRKKAMYPDDCPHRAFFKCATPNGCQGCYHNPDKKEALKPKRGHPFEEGESKNAKDHWFYGNKKAAKEQLKNLDDIKNGRGLLKGGTRTYLRYARKKSEEDEDW